MTDNMQKQPEILIVDDILINRMLLTDILTSLGCRCTKAHNGEEASNNTSNHEERAICLPL